MSYSSPIGNSVIVNDSNADAFLAQYKKGGACEHLSCGLPEGSPAPFSSPYVTQFDDSKINLLDWKEIKERIEAAERTETSTYDLMLKHQLKDTDQNGTNYCWAHSTYNAMQCKRLIQGDKIIDLEPASLAAIIKGGRNVGGWPDESVAGAAEIGFCESQYWGHNSRNLRQDTPEMRENASKHRILEFIATHGDKEQRFQQAASLAVQYHPLSAGFNWWGHAVCLVWYHILPSGEVGVRIRNSHAGNNDLIILSGSKKYAEEALAVQSVTGVAT